MNCNCDKSTCLLKGDNIQLYKNAATKEYHLQNENTFSKNRVKSTSIVSIARPDVKLVNFKTEFVCEIMKSYIRQAICYQISKESNEDFHKMHQKITSNMDVEITQNIKLRTIYRKSMEKQKDLKNEILTYENREKELRKELKKLKKKNKIMTHCIGEMREMPNDPKPELSDFLPDENISRTTNYIMEYYEKIKMYMVKKEISLSNLCRKKNKDVSKYCQIFVNLKCQRIELAHPEVENIKSDSDFFRLLDTY